MGIEGIGILCSDSLLRPFELHSEWIVILKDWKSIY